jgi:two-component system chemotaxis response regulator CheY
MTNGLILGVMAAVLGVKAYTLLSLGKLEREIHDLKADDLEVTGKIIALDATRTQLLRDHKDILADLDTLENQKIQLMTNIQKYGAVPVEEPSLDESVTSPGGETQPAESDGPAGENDETVETTDSPTKTRLVDAGSSPESAESQDDAADTVRILIVDDNDELRVLLSEVFSRTYAVDRAADGLEALNLILKQGQKYDAVITDLNMPNLDGMTFLEHVPEETNVIVMSAYLDRPEFSAAAAHPRVFCTIEKPFKLGMIKDAVARLLEERAVAEPLDQKTSEQGSE